MENRTLTVTGEAKLGFAPDRVAIIMDFSKTEEQYEEAVRKANLMTKVVKTLVKDAGLDPESVKTSRYNIHPRFDSEPDGKGSYKRVFKGHEVNLTFDIEFPFDNETLSKVIEKLSKTNQKINLEFRLSDVESCRDKVIEAAAKDAIKKAKLLALTSGVKLGEIKSIEYGYGVIKFEEMSEYSIQNCQMMAMPSMDINPEDKSIQERVIISWNIIE